MSRKIPKYEYANLDRKPLLNYNELMTLLSIRTRLSEKSVKKVYQALIEYLIEDLKTNGKTRLKWLGTFDSYVTEGGVRMIPVGNGKRVEKYCSPKRKVKFTPAESFDENLNLDLGVNSIRTAREKWKKGQLIENDSPLKIERGIAVKNAINEMAIKAKNRNPDEIEIAEEELSIMDEEWEE